MNTDPATQNPPTNDEKVTLYTIPELKAAVKNTVNNYYNISTDSNLGYY